MHDITEYDISVYDVSVYDTSVYDISVDDICVYDISVEKGEKGENVRCGGGAGLITRTPYLGYGE